MDIEALKAQILMGNPADPTQKSLRDKLKLLQVQKVQPKPLPQPKTDHFTGIHKYLEDAEAGLMADPNTVTQDPRYDTSGAFALTHDAANMAGVGAVAGSIKVGSKKAGKLLPEIPKALDKAEDYATVARKGIANMKKGGIGKYLGKADDAQERLTDMPEMLKKYQVEPGKHKYSFVHNNEKAFKDPTDQFGQSKEASGKYMSLVSPKYAPQQAKYWKDNNLTNMETGEIEFKNPLIVQQGERARDWKDALSKQYGGKTKKDLTKALIDDGYDGIITMDKNGEPSEVVHFDRLLPNVPQQQITDIPDDRELLALHNLSSSGVEKASQMGGIPLPSIAYTKADIPFEDFGDISLVGGKNLVQNAYMGDVYSPRVPRQEFKINQKALDSSIDELRKYKAITGESKYSRLDDDLGTSPKEVLSIANQNNTLKAMFLQEAKGVSITPQMTKLNIPKLVPDGVGYSPTVLAKIMSGEGIKIPNDFYHDPVKGKEVSKLLHRFADDIYNDSLKKGTPDVVASEMKKAFIEKYIDPKTGVPYVGATDHLFYRINELARESKEVVDTEAVHNTIKEAMKDIPDVEYHDWIKNRFSDVYEKGYFTSKKGTKKDYTLDNIVEDMTGHTRAKERNLTFGIGELRAKIAKKFDGVDDMKKHKGMLSSKEMSSEAHDKTNDQYNEIRELFTPRLEKRGFGSWEANDEVGRILSKVGSTITEGKVATVMRNGGLEPTSSEVKKVFQFLKELQTAPTSYFEGKPQRAVGFDEFEGALIPKEMYENVKKYLPDKPNFKALPYDPKEAGARQKLLEKYFKETMFMAGGVPIGVQQYLSEEEN